MNKKGHPQNLVAAHPGNVNAARHGAYSRRIIEERAADIQAELFGDYSFTPAERIAVQEVARCMAILDAIDHDLGERGLVDMKGHARSLLDHRVRISRRLDAWLAKISTTVERQTVHEYELRLFTHDDYIRETKRIALGNDPTTRSRDRLDALKTLQLLQMVWASQWLEEYFEAHPEKRADYAMKSFQL